MKNELQEAIKEVRQVAENHKPYYKPFITIKGEVIIVCLQPFDELDYNQKAFLTDEHFETEIDTFEWIEKWHTGKTNFTLERIRQLAYN